MTYSIVARDAATGELGVAVQTALPFVGRACPWAEAGIGAATTQASTRISHGASALRLLRHDHTAPEAIAALIAADKDAPIRQLAVVDTQGNAAAHTGSQTIQFAGHHVGEGFSVQANMMATEGVPEAMADAFLNTEGMLVERMLAALHAAQALGGDFRGQQSAALKIVSGELPKNPADGVRYDVRVDDHPDPVGELERLCKKQRAMFVFWEAFERMGENDVEGALAIYESAVRLQPDDIQSRFWFAYDAALEHGQLDPVREIFVSVFREDRRWLACLQRTAAARAPKHVALLDQITALAD